jgi:hypothetical protein
MGVGAWLPRLLFSPHTTVLFPNTYLRVSDVMAVLAASDVLALMWNSTFTV